jgi:hypothetical protein
MHTSDTARPKRRFTVFIPGNPGDLRFAERFLRGSQSLLEESWGGPLLTFEHLRLDEQPQSMLPYAVHHADQVRAHLAGVGVDIADVELELVAYSVGAYLSYLIVAHDLLPVARMRWLFPFVMRPRLEGRLQLALYRSPRFYRDLLALWRRAPLRLTRWLIGYAGAGEHTEWVHDILRTPHARSYFVMAAAEDAELVARTSLDDILTHPLFRDPARFRCLTTTKDRWVSDAALAALAPFTHPIERPVSHDFVLDQGDCEVVARALSGMNAVF